MADKTETVQADPKLVARYDKATDKQKGDLLLKVLAEQGNLRSNVRRVFGQGPGWTEREAKKLGVTLPAASRGRQQNGAVRSTPKKAAAKSPAKAPAKKAPAAAAKKAPAAKATATRRPAAKRAVKKAS